MIISKKTQAKHQKRVDAEIDKMFEKHKLSECKTADDLRQKGYMLVCESNSRGSDLKLLCIVDEAHVDLHYL